MDLINNKSSIDIITGPMFSGKTTELIRRLTIFVEAGMSVLYVNSILDTRQFTHVQKRRFLLRPYLVKELLILVIKYQLAQAIPIFLYVEVVIIFMFEFY